MGEKVTMDKMFDNLKLYTDGADIESMLAAASDPLIGGLTTNPTLMKKAGVRNYRTFAIDVLSKIKDKPISFEVFSDDFNVMEKQALEIDSWGKNVYVKIPVMNSMESGSYGLIRKLASQGVKLNITAIMTLEQVLRTCEAVGSSQGVISVFAGRIADTGRDPIPLMKAAKEICRSISPNSELLWASCREVLNIFHADEAGCDIVTVPPGLLSKLKANKQKNLSQFSLETVQMFSRDAKEAGFEL